MAGELETTAMRRAIALSALGCGTTSPNPPVGCAILDRHGKTVGTGYHKRKGEPHAEAYAVAEAGERARGGTAVVTLEPCVHFGRTPPCHQGLIDAGIVRTVVALIDPTSRAEGGVAKLRAAGIDVEVGVLADEAALVLRPWLATLDVQRPIVTAVCDDSRERLRTSADVILAADGTVCEAVAGSHGTGILDLPTTPLTGNPSDILNRLYSAGARFVLLIASNSIVHGFADARCLDEIVTTAYLDIPQGFRLADVRKLDNDTVECTYRAASRGTQSGHNAMGR